MPRYFATPGDAQAHAVHLHTSRTFHSYCPEQREAAWIRASISLAGRGGAGSVSIFGGVVLLSFFWWWRGGIFGVFHCLVASFLRILGSVLILGSGSGICRS